MDAINVAQEIKDFVFGFQFRNKPVDMIDNEYVTLHVNYEVKE